MSEKGATISEPPSGVDLSRFVCHRCGNCCRGEGTVFLSDHRLDQIARYLHLSHHQFAAAYLIPNTEASRAARYTGLSLPLLAKLQRRDLLLLYRQPDGGFHLRSRENPTRDCIFLQADGCQIHAVKPEQCASFPMKWRNPDSFETCAGLRALSGLADASSMNSHPTKQDAAQS